jgi:hypothetical protein
MTSDTHAKHLLDLDWLERFAGQMHVPSISQRHGAH